MKNLSCKLCGVKIDKKEDPWCCITHVSKKGKEYGKVYLCDAICAMDYLNRCYRLDENAFIMTSDGKKWSLRDFWDFLRK